MAFSYQNYTGDAVTTQFSITFTYQDTSEISVTVDGVAETGLTFPSASTVQLTSAPTSGALVQVRRTTDLTARAVDFASGSILTEEDLDDSNIQVFHAAQEAIDQVNDSIFLDTDDKWEANSKVIKNVGTPTSNDDAATKAYADGISAAAASAATAAASAAVTAATGAIIPDATKLAIHPIGTQYTLSDGVTTDYSAKHYANAASTSAGNASTSETNAAASATAAQAAEASALAAFDSFDDRYLGTFTTAAEPTTDNDGDPLAAGMLYFNTTDAAMKVYTGSVWAAAYVSGAGYLAASNNLSDVADAATARTNLGVEIGVDVQAYDATILTSSDIGSTVQAYDADTAKLDVAQSFTAAQVGSTQTASVSGNTTLDFSTYQNFVLTLTGNTTLDNPTTETAGQSGFIVFSQTGGYTVSLGADYETAGGAGITLSASGDDIVPYVVMASGRILLGTPQLAFA